MAEVDEDQVTVPSSTVQAQNPEQGESRTMVAGDQHLEQLVGEFLAAGYSLNEADAADRSKIIAHLIKTQISTI